MARIEVAIDTAAQHDKTARADDTLAAFDFAWGPSPLYGLAKGVTITYCDTRFPDKVTRIFLDVQMLGVAYTLMLLQMKSAEIEIGGEGGDDGE